MDLGLFILLALVWGFLSMLGKAAQKGGARRQSQVPVPRRPERGPPTTFDELLTEMRGQLERAKEADERRSHLPLPGAEEVEERESLEIVPVVVPRELPAPAQSRVVVDSDQEAQALVRRRYNEAEARNRGLTAADHRAFDALIRRKAPKPVAAAHPSKLRQALIWNEVLGKPVSMRDEQ